jgi:hypothetical protein
MVTDLDRHCNLRGVELLQILYTDGNQMFDVGEVAFDAIESYSIVWLCLLEPRRINRLVDYTNDNHYDRNIAADDISNLVRDAIRALHENDFVKQFNNLLADFAKNGISSWALRAIADAYVKKYLQQ